MNQTENPPIKKEVQVLFSNLALAQAWLCNYDELQKYTYHRHELKQTMKRCCQLIENHTNPLLEIMFEKGENIIQAHVGAVEYLTKLMATKPTHDLVAMVETLQNMEKQIQEADETAGI